MNERNIVIRCAQALAIWAVFNVAYADVNKAYLEKKVGDYVVRLPLLPGFAPSCEENPEFSERAKKLTPQSHVFLTCASDLLKWSNFKAGKPSSDLYPLLVVAVQRHQPGGPFTTDEFTKLKNAAHAQLGDMIASDKGIPRTVRSGDDAVSANGTKRSTTNYEQTMQGFFDAPSTVPSFSFVTSRRFTLSEAGKTYEVREVTGISTIFYFGELLQLMVVDSAGSNADTSKARYITKYWLDAFNVLNKAQVK